MALTYVGLSDHDQAISRLEKAAEERDPVISQLNANPGVDSLRTDLCVQAFLRHMHFLEAAASGVVEAP